MVSTVRSFTWELGCIRVLSLAHCSLFWCWRCIRMFSTLVHIGGFFRLMTWCSSWMPRRSVSPSSRCGRLSWKVKESVSTSRRPSSWSLVVAMMSSRNLVNTPALSAVVVWAATPSCAHSVWCGFTRSAMASLSDWFPTKAMSVRVSLGPSMAELWLNGCRWRHAWCGNHFLLPRGYAVLW